MISPWNGLPDQPERNGWHWLAGQHFRDFWGSVFWSAKAGMWGYGTMSPELCAQRCIYGGPVLTPPELAQMLSDQREKDAQVAERYASQFAQPFPTLGSDCRNIAAGIRANPLAIRALTDDEGKKS